MTGPPDDPPKVLPAEVVAQIAEAERQRGGPSEPRPLANPVSVVETSAEEMLAACASEPETDIGNGRRLLIRHGQRIIHVARVGWHGFDGLRWKEDEDGSVVRPLAQQTAELIAEEALSLAGNGEEYSKIAEGRTVEADLETLGHPKKTWSEDILARHHELTRIADAGQRARKAAGARRASRRRHARASAGTAKINNMLIEAAPHVACMVDRLNIDLYAVNCKSGTLRFVRKEDEESDPDDPRYLWDWRLDRHDAADFISKLVPHRFKPVCRSPELEAFLGRVQPDREMRDFLQRLSGYLLLGITDEQIFVIFHGGGRNGKSTFVSLLCHVLGDYAVTLGIESFTGEERRGGGDATPDLARLPGARLVASEEPDQGVRLKEGLIKRVTGGTKIPVRRLHQDFIEVLPQFTPILSCNPKPEIRDMSEGLWRRVLMVPWQVQIPKHEVDKRLLPRLEAEAQGVFAWMVDGAIAYLNHGLRPPKQVLLATEDYRQESDFIGSFIRTACVVTGEADDTALPADLFIAYQNWQSMAGGMELHKNTFFKRFPAYCQQYFEAPDGSMRQFCKDKSGTTIYRGIIVRTEFVAPGKTSSSGAADGQ